MRGTLPSRERSSNILSLANCYSGSQRKLISLDAVWAEKQRPEAEQNSVRDREFGRASPRRVDEQELGLHEKAVRDNRSCATGSQELGDRGQQMRQKRDKILLD
jgi:hypothetical protein